MAKKQKSGLYRAKIKIGVDGSGNAVYKYVSGRTQRELEEEKRQAIAHYVEGKAALSDRLFGEYATNWFRAIKAPGLSASSLQSYRTALNKDIFPAFGDRNIRAITATELSDFMNGFAGRSATKITVVFAALCGIFEAACADMILQSNPMEHVLHPKSTPPAEKIALTPEQRRAIERVCACNPQAAYLALLYYLGLRPGEARGLQWGDIDWARETVHIQRDIDDKNGGMPGAVKSKKSNRIIPLPEALSDVLGPLRGLPNVYVARGEKGGVLSKTSAERRWVELMCECGMAEPAKPNCYRAGDIRAQYKAIITPHALRHNYATMCWERGLDPYTTMRLMGHSSIKVTMDIYTHINDRQLTTMREKVDGLFKKSCKKVAQGRSEHDWRV